MEGQSKKKKVVVIGGGYIGMEVAAALTAWKIDTTVCYVIFPFEMFLLEWHPFCYRMEKKILVK